MLNITNYQRNANQNDSEGSSLTVRMAIIKKSASNKCWRWCGERGTLLHCQWECKLVHLLWRTTWRLLKRLKIELPYAPTIPLLGHIHRENHNFKRYIYPNVHYPTIYNSQRRRQPKCPSEEWIKKMCYIYKTEYYSVIKMNKNVPFAETWTDLSYRSMSKRKTNIISIICRIQKNYSDELICKAEIDTDVENKQCMDIEEGRRGGMNWEIGSDIYILLCIK